MQQKDSFVIQLEYEVTEKDPGMRVHIVQVKLDSVNTKF